MPNTNHSVKTYPKRVAFCEKAKGVLTDSPVGLESGCAVPRPKSVTFPRGIQFEIVFRITMKEGFPMSITFWLVMIVLALFLGVLLTAANNDDQTKGL